MTEMEYLIHKLFKAADTGQTDRAEHAERVCEFLERVGFSAAARALVFLHLAHPAVEVPPASPGQANPMRDQLCFGLQIGWRPAAAWLSDHGRMVNAGNLCRVFRADLMEKHRVAAAHAAARSFRWIAGGALVAIGEHRADAMDKAAERWAAGLAGSSAPAADGVAPCCATLRPELKEGSLFNSLSFENQGRNTGGGSADPAAGSSADRPPILGLPKAIWEPGLTDNQVAELARKWWNHFQPDQHNPADFLGAIFAARVLAKGPQEKYVNSCLANGVRPEWKRKAAELIQRHEQRRAEQARTASYSQPSKPENANA